MTFAPNTIYRDLMKMVHPDLHPEMSNAGERAKEVNKFKNNTDALRRLAIIWGFIQGRPTEQTTANRNYTYTRPNVINTIYDLGLGANHNYILQNVFVRINIGRVVTINKVLRTTKKCVVVDYYGVEKTVRMSNVVRREG